MVRFPDISMLRFARLTLVAGLLTAGCGVFEPTPDAVYRLVSIRGLPLPGATTSAPPVNGVEAFYETVSNVISLHFRTREFEAVTTSRIAAGGLVFNETTVRSRVGRFRIVGDSLFALYQMDNLGIFDHRFGIHDQGRTLHRDGSDLATDLRWERQ